jgi:hypothetical protein
MTCRLTGCLQPSSPLFSHICGSAFHRYEFCSEGHQQRWLLHEGKMQPNQLLRTTAVDSPTLMYQAREAEQANNAQP